ncbi:hypothetical protein H4696_007689 [Amycolatopsis lexingtonensis]|uniref:Uncharacterized protein n=1 Tax=Amycolatopsis lexingtonensis TaxID=218822 RepID=A0ABR9IBN3_9PSEU|nr:hypothetical protein [Amycolatopsis lexingtonensis]
MFDRQCPHEPNILGGSLLQRRSQFGSRQHPTARRFDGNGSKQPSGQRQRVISRRGSAQNVFRQRLRHAISSDRDRPDDVTTMGQPPVFPYRPTNFDDVVLGGPSPNATPDLELGQPRQGEQQVGDISREFFKKSVAIDVIPQRKPDLGVEPLRNIPVHRPRQPKNGNLALDPGGFPGPIGGESDPTGTGDNARFIGNGPHGGEPDPELPDGLAGLPGSPKRGKRSNTPSIERRTGVGEPEFPVHKGHLHAPRHTGGHGGIGGVLGQLDEEPIPIGPDPQIALDVGVFDEPRRRVPPSTQRRLTKPTGTERIAPDGLSAQHRHAGRPRSRRPERAPAPR